MSRNGVGKRSNLAVFISMYFRYPAHNWSRAGKPVIFLMFSGILNKVLNPEQLLLTSSPCLLSSSSSQPLTMVLKQMHVGVSMVHNKFHREGPPPALLGMMCSRALCVNRCPSIAACGSSSGVSAKGNISLLI